jgi:hypothetical protein
MIQHSSENIKTDVSVSVPIFKAAERMAEKLGLSLTELYTIALTSYMAKYQENITETLDRIYEHESSAIEPVLINAQTASLGQESW